MSPDLEVNKRDDRKGSGNDALVYSELLGKTDNDKFNGKESEVSERMFKIEKRKSSVGLQRMLSEGDDEEDLQDIDMILREMELTDDLSCGYWFFRGAFIQRFANKTAYVILYGVVGLIFSMTYAYFNGTITTIEKRFKIPSRNTGIISVGNDISQMFVSALLSYYAGSRHRPRWLGLGLMTIVTFCLMTSIPHFLYGPGDDSLALTEEHGGFLNNFTTADLILKEKQKDLCHIGGESQQCEKREGNLSPQIILFIAQFISGIGGSLYFTLGSSYMDDNTPKSQTPLLLSFSYFLRMIGPAAGYAIASFCLKIYIAPHLTPTITNNDPRWLGAWWMGWIIIGVALIIPTFLISLFPKQLPRAAARATLANMKKKAARKLLRLSSIRGNEEDFEEDQEAVRKTSFKDMASTFKRLFKNKIYLYNNFASIFYCFGYMPYWIFTPKYIEIQYKQTAATSSLVTGTVALVFSAMGVLIAGICISKFKPKARYMATWNVVVCFMTVFGMLSYAFIGCDENENSMQVNIPDPNSLTPTCNSACQCDYVPYSPVCGSDGKTYISPCHAGCKKTMTIDGRQVFYDCDCIVVGNQSHYESTEMPTTEDYDTTANSLFGESLILDYEEDGMLGQATSGPCKVNCNGPFKLFLAVMCFLKFIGASARATNFLVSVRSVDEKDKAASMGLSMTMLSLFALIPSPIFFGWVLDSFCLVWGKTCAAKGNCWLYDPKALRYYLNITTTTFLLIGSICDIGVWVYSKNLKIFDEEIKESEINAVRRVEASNEKLSEI
ncbi:hypothetical protein ACFFRR_007383 [Megaselia abdita]